MMIIPTSMQPNAILLDEHGNPVPQAAPKPILTATPKIEPKRERDYDDDRRSRRRPASEKKPSGPTWPWTIGVIGAIAAFVLLFSAFIALFAYRPPPEKQHVLVVDNRSPDIGKPQTIGRVEGNRLFLENGIVQFQTRLNENDMFDNGPGANGFFKTNRFEVELRGGQQYVIDVQGRGLDKFVRVENRFGNMLDFRHQQGPGGASLRFTPFETANYIVYVSNVEPRAGDFTVSIREAHLAKPGAP